MRGSVIRRYKGSWSLVLDLGRERDPVTGKHRRKQKWITFRGTKRQAQDQLTELLRAHNHGDFVEPSKYTLGTWLEEWVEKAVKPPLRRAPTYVRYKGIIEQHLLKAPIAALPIQKVRPSDIEAYYATSAMAPATIALHHAILHRALLKGLRDRIVSRNVADEIEGKPRARRDREEARKHCWTREEARTFLATAKKAGAQPVAFYTLALEAARVKANSVASSGRTSTSTPGGLRSSSSYSHQGRSRPSDRRRPAGHGRSPSRRRRWSCCAHTSGIRPRSSSPTGPSIMIMALCSRRNGASFDDVPTPSGNRCKSIISASTNSTS
jgi:hypothetical protein